MTNNSVDLLVKNGANLFFLNAQLCGCRTTSGKICLRSVRGSLTQFVAAFVCVEILGGPVSI